MTSTDNEVVLADLDMLGQQPLVNLFTPLCFFYPTPREAASRDLAPVLTRGLQRLTDNFPWIAGQVVGDGQKAGLTKIVPLPSHPIPELVVKKHGSSFPSFDDLVKADFPFKFLDEEVLCPRSSYPGQQEDASTEFPVLNVQLNYIEGGIILGFVTHHSTCDIMGMGAILSLLNKACGDQPFTDDELKTGNRRLDNPIQLLEEKIEVKGNPRLEMQVTPESDANHVAPANLPPPTDCSWAYFSFSASSLASLKAAATKEIPADGAPFISTDDVLTAFVWQCITRARYEDLDPGPGSVCARAIDTRPYLDLPSTYPGMMQNQTYTHLDLAAAAEAPLGFLASLLRQEIKPAELAKDTRALITLMTHDTDKGRYSLACGVDWTRDTMVSSWSKVDGYNMDFGIGIKPKKVRRPRFPPVPGLVFFMPKGRDGEIGVAISLRDEEMQRLNGNLDWGKWATYVG